MIGVIYARYSSDNQRDESIDGQVRECMAFAKKNDIQIIETYIDRALSAKTDNRPDFQRMIKDSAKKKFDVILLWKLDRFARNKYDSAHYRHILGKNNVKIISATEQISNGPEGILLTTKLYCGKCGCFMVGESGTSHTNKVHHYYKCVNAKNHKGCDKKTVKKDWIENLVIDEVRKFLLDDELMNKLADSVMELQSKENVVLPVLQKQLKEVQKGIDNFMNAIQMGIITASTKERLEELEKQKSELSVQIMKEEMTQPTLTKEQILFWLKKLRKLNPQKLEHRRKLIDSFINAIFLYDDRVVITFNYKDGTKEVTFKDLEKSGLGSDLTALAAPNP